MDLVRLTALDSQTTTFNDHPANVIEVNIYTTNVSGSEVPSFRSQSEPSLPSEHLIKPDLRSTRSITNSEIAAPSSLDAVGMEGTGQFRTLGDQAEHLATQELNRGGYWCLLRPKSYKIYEKIYDSCKHTDGWVSCKQADLCMSPGAQC
jgi:hypothetical protein